MRISLPEKWIDALIARAKKTPMEHLPGYMNRWWLLPYPQGHKHGLERPSVRIHEILRSDDDRAVHDHPWDYWTLILRGGYYELTPYYEHGIYAGTRVEWCGPGRFLRRKAAHLHRLEVPQGTTCWTLFISFSWKQKWGFVENLDYKTYWKNYHNLK